MYLLEGGERKTGDCLREGGEGKKKGVTCRGERGKSSFFNEKEGVRNFSLHCVPGINSTP